MQINFPEKIANLITEITRKRDNDIGLLSENYISIVTSLALYNWIIDNMSEDRSLVIIDNKKNEIVEEIEVNY